MFSFTYIERRVANIPIRTTIPKIKSTKEILIVEVRRALKNVICRPDFDSLITLFVIIQKYSIEKLRKEI